MKIRKNSEQRNFEVNRLALTHKEMKELLESKTVEMFDSRTFEKLNYEKNDAFSYEVTIRVFSDDCKEVKVVYNDDFGAYETVVVTNDDRKVPVCL